MKNFKRYLPLLANIFTAFISGFVYLFMKTGLQIVQYDTVKYLAFRFTVGFVVLTLLLITKLQNVNYKNKPFFLLLFCGALNPLVSQVLEATAVGYAPTSQIAVIFSLQPILIVGLSALINRELPTKRQVFFMMVSVAGVLLINLIGGQVTGGTWYGLVLILCAVLVISAQRVFVRRATGRFTAFEIIYVTTGMGAFGFSCLTLFSHAAEGRLGFFFDGLMNPGFAVSILYMGIMSCVVGFLCSTYATGRLPIAVSSSTAMLGTVITVLVGVFVLGEVFRPIDIAGTAITLLGIIGMSLSYNVRKTNRFMEKKDS